MIVLIRLAMAIMGGVVVLKAGALRACGFNMVRKPNRAKVLTQESRQRAAAAAARLLTA
jgi:hypothetical protein